MDQRADSWEKVWTDTAATQTSILGGLKVVMPQAMQEDVDPITFEQLDTVVGRLNAKKAKGIDAMGPIEVQRLPAPARQELVQLYNRVEDEGMWPPQLFA
eukprot:1418516-Pyramimonas_sp.AAC.1